MFGRHPFHFGGGNEKEFNEEEYEKQRELILKNWKFVNETVYGKIIEIDKKSKDKNNQHKDSRRFLFEFDEQEYVMVRLNFGKEVKQAKTSPKFYGPFKAIKKENHYELYDRNGTFFKKCPQQQLKRIKIADEKLLIDLKTDESLLDTKINNYIEKQDKDPDYIPDSVETTHLVESDEILDEANENQIKNSELRLPKRKRKSKKEKSEVTEEKKTQQKRSDVVLKGKRRKPKK